MEKSDWVKSAVTIVTAVAASFGAAVSQTADKADTNLLMNLEHRFEDAALSNCSADNALAQKIREILLIAPTDPDTSERQRQVFLRQALERFEIRDCEALVRGES